MEMVLATDMKQHFALVAKFKTLMTHARTTAPSGVALRPSTTSGPPVRQRSATGLTCSMCSLWNDLEKHLFTSALADITYLDVATAMKRLSGKFCGCTGDRDTHYTSVGPTSVLVGASLQGRVQAEHCGAAVQGSRWRS